MTTIQTAAATRQTDADPAVIAFRNWRRARQVVLALEEADSPNDEAEFNAACGVERAAFGSLSDAAATTPVGLVMKLAALGFLIPESHETSAHNFEFLFDPATARWSFDLQGRAFRSTFASALRMSGVDGVEGLRALA